jgi:DNA polymerase-4
MERVILHCDCNGFFASVETIDQPALKNVPMAVAGDPKNRTGIILAKNELAKACGIKTAETVYEARRKCPELVLVPPHHRRYQEVSRKVNALYLRYTDQVEPFGIDESWLDVTGSLSLLKITGPRLADELRNRVREEIGITISVGVSFCKILAKMGSDLKKPDATTVLTRENFREKIWPLPAGEMMFAGRSTVALLEKRGMKTIGDIARTEVDDLEKMMGKAGIQLWNHANGIDDEPVVPFDRLDEVKSVGNGLTFPRDLITMEELRAGVAILADEVAMRMREHGVKCQTVQVHIKDPAMKTISRQTTFQRPTRLQAELIDQAMKLIRANWRAGAPVRALTITATNLIPEDEDASQLSLFEDGGVKRLEKLEKLEDAVYNIRTRFGPDSIKAGAPETVIGRERRTHITKDSKEE